MPLPDVNSKMMNPERPGLNLTNEPEPPHKPATGAKVDYEAQKGHAAWVGDKLELSKVNDHFNFWHIPAVADKVNYCVVPATANTDIYVISMGYGGCEYHQLYNQAHNLYAFLHVYKGEGPAVAYTLGGGWVQQTKYRSLPIKQHCGQTGNNWSVSVVLGNHPVHGGGRNEVETCFVNIRPDGGGIKVFYRDPGDPHAF